MCDTSKDACIGLSYTFICLEPIFIFKILIFCVIMKTQLFRLHEKSAFDLTRSKYLAKLLIQKFTIFFFGLIMFNF